MLAGGWQTRGIQKAPQDMPANDQSPPTTAQEPVVSHSSPVKSFNKLFKPPKSTAEWAATYCSSHGQPFPCYGCKEFEYGARTRALILENNLAGNAIRAAAAKLWNDALQSAGVDPKTKCVHGHMCAEHYCEVCRLAPVDPDYDPDVFRTEIKKAMKQARTSLRGDEGKKDFNDLNQIIDIEIWKASKKYGKAMNEGLAYTIAMNQAGKYLTQRIEQRYVESTDVDGNTTRVPRFISMDNKPLDEHGNEKTTAAEIAVINSATQGTDFPVQTEQLQTLVATWHGQKRLVGDAMLRPDFNVRNVPGVPKSTVARIRQAVLKEFKGLTK